MNDPQNRMVANLDDDQKRFVQVDTPDGPEVVAATNEAGIYTLLLCEENPRREPILRWLTREVLPALRESGTYTIPQYVNRSRGCNAFVEIADFVNAVVAQLGATKGE